MGQYTENRVKMMETLPEDDNDEIKLEEAVKTFRNFSEALDDFIIRKGYTGVIEDVGAKIEYINSKFELASVAPIDSRVLKNWFSEKRNEKKNSSSVEEKFVSPLDIKKEFLFRFCFVFQLSIEESNEFFRKVCLQRSFDCHDIKEAIYYYALSNQLSYSEAKELIAKAPKTPDNGKGKIDINSNILYTDTIINEINRFKNSDELLKYFYDNRSQFGYNNATAYRTIKKIWSNISGASGLANKEKINLLCNDCEKLKMCSHMDLCCDECGEKDKCAINKRDETESVQRGCKARNCKKADCHKHNISICNCAKCACKKCNCKKEVRKPRTVWDIYLQILGFDNNQISILASDRSLGKILNDNKLLHTLAADSFPDRQGLEAIILRGGYKSNEPVRKILILLLFYEFWVKEALNNKDGEFPYEAYDGDNDRCICRINDCLSDSGYPLLYAGNPFDWIFVNAANKKYPLEIFRDFMLALYLIKEDELIAKV